LNRVVMANQIKGREQHLAKACGRLIKRVRDSDQAGWTKNMPPGAIARPNPARPRRLFAEFKHWTTAAKRAAFPKFHYKNSRSSRKNDARGGETWHGTASNSACVAEVGPGPRRGFAKTTEGGEASCGPWKEVVRMDAARIPVRPTSCDCHHGLAPIPVAAKERTMVEGQSCDWSFHRQEITQPAACPFLDLIQEGNMGG